MSNTHQKAFARSSLKPAGGSSQDTVVPIGEAILDAEPGTGRLRRMQRQGTANALRSIPRQTGRPSKSRWAGLR
jgi:hypothetical protein